MRASQRIVLCTAALLLIPARAQQLTPVGDWKTVDDKTGKPRAIVRIYENNGELFGRIEKILDPARVDRKCDKCTDDRKDQPVAGMIIVRRMKQSGNEYQGGDILDPDNGSVYRCKFKMVNGGKQLSVRGYLGFSLFGRSQTWTREPPPLSPGS